MPAIRETWVQEVLERRFFPHVESLGFVRDERQRPGLICFRRTVGSVVQIFAVLFARLGRAGFFIQFTEAPLEGIDYRGTHLVVEDIFPGNFALLRGWLLPERGQRWFRLEPPLWRRLILKQRDNPDQMVDRLLELFPEILAWWNDKTKGAHLMILPPVPPQPMPDHAPVSGCPVKPTLLQRFFARSYVWTIFFFGIAVCTALALAIQAPDLSRMFFSVVVGAAGGFLIAWVCFNILWRVRGWINGGPFRKGDLVQVIAGVHAGKIAIVYEEWHPRSQVRIDLGRQEWKDVKDVFTHVELCKVERAGPNVP